MRFQAGTMVFWHERDIEHAFANGIVGFDPRFFGQSGGLKGWELAMAVWAWPGVQKVIVCVNMGLAWIVIIPNSLDSVTV